MLGVASLAGTDRFFLDEDGFAFTDEHPESLQATLEIFIDLLDEVERSGTVLAWDGIWDIQARSGRTLATLLFVPSEIDRDIRRLLGARFDKIQKYDETLNPSLTSICNGQSTGISPGISICAEKRRSGRAACCVTTNQSGRIGDVEISDGAGDAILAPFLVQADQVPDFWRFALDVERAPNIEIHEVACWAFPQLTFAPGVWRQVRRFVGPAETSRRLLLQNLAGLNDHAPSVWREEVQSHVIAARMKVLAGVDCSLESPNTHNNSAAMREREVDFDGRIVMCEWHAKLEPHQNRVHFKVQDDRVYVGIFTDHLST
ncbi:hypothetical protein [Lapillicoccus jejuensis]|uniref:Uncharacterized protein n=1 Tax=Lapillicoccus jejuensis TaxID=402171 RepID=A0A542DZG5_9MICO|nr:hypothetical protein [Lapillicoccus jejuensis]TQJ08446.1 hypothetical protein FB458_1535 [Lapillicoccus jejuensis]